MDTDPDNWFSDYISPDFIQMHRIRRVVYSGRSKFQSVDVVDTDSFGRCLILDGKIQSSENDEFIYHEALVHPPMLIHPQPEVVFIAGGGEGATLCQVLAHSSVKRVVMVDIDEKVVNLCRELLPSFHKGSFSDSRLELYHVDARQFLEEQRNRYDVIIIDIPEPLEGGPAYLLYTREFYQLVEQRLTEDGIISVQAGAADWNNLQNFAGVVSTLQASFPLVCPYHVPVPSFGGSWGFVTASRKLNPTYLLPDEVDRRISNRLITNLRFYDGLSHQNIFTLPKHLREKVTEQQRIITDRDPLFIQ